MSINPKELKALADACRKAGIKHFKNSDLEFTLTDEAPQSKYKAKKASKSDSVASGNLDVESDMLSQEDLLFWSTVAVPSDASAPEGN